VSGVALTLFVVVSAAVTDLVALALVGVLAALVTSVIVVVTDALVVILIAVITAVVIFVVVVRIDDCRPVLAVNVPRDLANNRVAATPDLSPVAISRYAHNVARIDVNLKQSTAAGAGVLMRPDV